MNPSTPSTTETNGTKPNPQTVADFDQPVVLKQSPKLSRAVIWVMLVSTGAFCLWAYFGKLEQVITATGQLKPQGDVKEIQAPINGVVESVLVEDGDRVKVGETLLTFDSKAAEASKTSLEAIKQSLLQENQLYRAVISQNTNIPALQKQITQMNLPPEVTSLALNRLAVVSEIQVLNAQLGQGNSAMDGEQLARVNAAKQEAESRIQASKLEYEQLQQQLAQNNVQLADARKQLITDRQVLAKILARNQESTKKAEDNLASEKKILDRVSDPDLAGAVAELQIDRQRQQVIEREAQLIEQEANGKIEFDQQQQRVDTRLAEIQQLQKEQQRLQLDIRQANQEWINAKSTVSLTVRQQLDNAKQRLAAIDSELNKLIVENTKRLSEVDSQLAQANETLEYQDVTAPIAGTVFDLKASPRFVPRAGQAEPLLKIVPDDVLVAEVYVSNRDIGFVRQRFNEEKEGGEKVATVVRIDTYTFNRYGDIEGKILDIGTDALPPDQIYPYARFPIRVELEKQDLGKDELPLQSGMSVSVNIKIRENRRVYELLTDLFSRNVDELKRQK
jgi:hemolysin D